ncbi:MAG: hypothetical protein COW03_09860 [Cytophagales bacterium CG12_big_fil_rev_8_21_14_0_65_40_12]|nr:MAG: hypothetical protein COW03_09860 [Cytophagales bacterium CG12_big_fil_rev_8_21_14_0_65_40_12]PIW04634.1 MAG: hypothetical protein COW40_08985 [Cytophagales bacterium CG17_big_fil_post_rev_8_21_14_2_50_40_13]
MLGKIFGETIAKTKRNRIKPSINIVYKFWTQIGQFFFIRKAEIEIILKNQSSQIGKQSESK